MLLSPQNNFMLLSCKVYLGREKSVLETARRFPSRRLSHTLEIRVHQITLGRYSDLNSCNLQLTQENVEDTIMHKA